MWSASPEATTYGAASSVKSVMSLRTPGSKVPVAKMHILCEDDAVIGSAFYIMDHVKGRNFRQPTLDGLTPAERGAVMDERELVIGVLIIRVGNRLDTIGCGDVHNTASLLDEPVR